MLLVLMMMVMMLLLLLLLLLLQVVASAAFVVAVAVDGGVAAEICPTSHFCWPSTLGGGCRPNSSLPHRHGGWKM